MTMAILNAHWLYSQKAEYGIFDKSTDIGAVGKAGSVSYDPENQQYLIEGSGTNIWFGQDELQYAWKKVSGDFILITHLKFIDEGVDPHRKIGWMVRSGLEGTSPHVSAVVHGDGLTSLQFRKTAGADMEQKAFEITAPDVVKLVRKGNKYTMYAARYGEPFGEGQSIDMEVGNDVYAGLFVCSHNNNVSEKALFSNVRIVFPAPDDFVPYTDYIGSNLEIMNLESGLRKIIYQADNSIQAPNWTPDNKRLIYNSEGLLYNYDLQTHKPSVLNSGFANDNNNDHVLSFDGKYLGISHHSESHEGQSMVYYMPADGGEPKQVTSTGPSYLHGWSPDGKFLIYTGGRNNEYDIYKISVNGGTEINLTQTKGLDDGPEYTPDGNYIYFNSSRTGTMKLWRMKPDGSGQEQVTFDEYNDWFPHISPDGKEIIFLSYLPEVDADDHPFYKHVYLRKMPVAGGKPKVIAYLYGGQGTINVPSWSPDGKKIAFISNTDFSREK